MIRYIIGIDYGHGETSAAFVDLQAVGTPVEDLTITGNEKKIHSMMATFADYETTEIENIDPNDWVLYPDWSTLRYALTPEKLSKSIPPFAAYFKGPVSKGRDGKSKEIDGITKKMFGVFCRKVYDEIIENNKFLTPAVYDQSGRVIVESNFVLYVACPSGWEDNEKLGLRQITAYKEFLMENGVPCQDIVQESRAAYVTARDTVLKGLTYKETPGVLIVDYGSSTIDLTWFGNKPAFTDGYELGARNVEEILFDYLLNNEEPAKVAYNNYTKYVHSLVARMVSKYGMRLQKELFFDLLAKKNIPDPSKKLAAVKLAEVTPSDAVDDSDPDFRFTSEKPLLKDNVMHILETYKVTNVSLNNETYIGAVIEKLRNFTENPEVGDVDYVVLTGGATKMSFLQDLVKSIYNIDDNHLIVDNIAPSFAISRGVATYGVKKYYADPILNQVEDTFNETWGNEDWLTPKLDSFFEKIAQQTYRDEMNAVLDKWLNGDIVADTNHNLKEYLDEIIKEKEKVETLNDTWQRVKFSDPVVAGAHSIHALLTSLFDFIDDEKNTSRINERIDTSISLDAFDEHIDGVQDGIMTLLAKYIKVYFPNDTEDFNDVFTFDIPTKIDVTFDKGIKNSLLCSLIETCYNHVGMRTVSTLNKNRDHLDDITGPGRRTLYTPLKTVIDEFATKITSSYDLTGCIKTCNNIIHSLLKEVNAKCELSTYTLE